MNEFLIGLLGAMLATNQVTAVSNVVARATGIAVPVTDPHDPVEREYQRLLAEDDAAQAEVDEWIKEDMAFADQAAGSQSITLQARIDQRFAAIDQGYEDFLRRHPQHARARLAYGSFLNDTGRDGEAMIQWEKARETEPTNPAAWNNLADYYSHRGPVKKAFEYLARAIELNPREPVYRQNLALVVFLFRKDAREYYQLEDDQQVLWRSLELYRKALELDPANFALATELAQVYYFLKPRAQADRTAADLDMALVDEALATWLAAVKLAHTDFDRQGVYLHLARVCMSHGRFAAARQHLAAVTHPAHNVLKARLERSLAYREQGTTPPGGGEE
ncbi:MAG: tetratricopeptide repeat protein [Verrucomicrobia bacterium]|nr:tetratricopeptide repeat protein [Verrucomicrobiota bacterium]